MTTPYSAQIKYVELIEREKTNVQQIKVFRDNAQIVPTGALYRLVAPDDTVLVDDETATIDGDGTCSYTVSSSVLPSSLDLGEGYREEFKVTISGTEYIFRRMASLVLRRLYPVISDADLTQTYSDLANLRPSSESSYQKYIDDSFYQILRKIRQRGMGYEYLVMTPESFYDAHRHLALYLIFRDFHSSISQGEGRYLELAQEHYKQFLQEFESINFIYDQSHENKPTDPNQRRAAQPVIYLTAPSYYGRKRRY